MSLVRLICAAALAAGVSACTPVSESSGPQAVTRSTPAAQSQQAQRSVSVSRVKVAVPQSLQVSEANLYYPRGDIVWRGEPIGDRHAQVKAIFEDAARRGVSNLRGSRSAVLNIEVKRFHALTEKARYSVGGVHALTFSYSLTDPATGAVLQQPTEVRADLRAFGGDDAIAADQAGQTQKVRITEHLAGVIATEMRSPGGYQHRELGFFGRLNQSN